MGIRRLYCARILSRPALLTGSPGSLFQRLS